MIAALRQLFKKDVPVQEEAEQVGGLIIYDDPDRALAKAVMHGERVIVFNHRALGADPQGGYDDTSLVATPEGVFEAQWRYPGGAAPVERLSYDQAVSRLEGARASLQ